MENFTNTYYLYNYYAFAKAADAAVLVNRNTYKPTGIIATVRTNAKIKRNSICPICDSGKKYKKCCGKDNVAKINHETQ